MSQIKGKKPFFLSSDRTTKFKTLKLTRMLFRVDEGIFKEEEGHIGT